MVRRLLVTFAVLPVALVLAEGVVRALDVKPRPIEALPSGMYRLSENPVLGFEYLPSRGAGQGEGPNWSINSHGFREREFSVQKAPGTYRIVAIGDSTTAGLLVRDTSKVFTRVLEEQLNAEAAQGRRFEVLNLGVGGYHTVQEAELLRTRALQLEPDLVLVTVCLNDFHAGSDGGLMTRLRRRNRMAADPGPGLYRALVRHSRLAFVLHHRLGLQLTEDERERWYEREVLAGASPVRLGFERIAALRERHGFELLTVVLPHFSSPFSAYEYAGIHADVRAAAEGLELELVDLLESFQSVADDASGFGIDRVHLSVEGHAVMARILMGLLRERPGMPLRAPRVEASSRE